MKNFLFALTITALGAMGCTTHENLTQQSTQVAQYTAENTQENAMVMIKIGNIDFSAVLYDNATTQELVKQFPVTYTMSELHGNEKYYYMSTSFPTNNERPATINKGDIMLYGNNCIMIFYDTFSNSYSYTKLGYIEDTTGLEEAVGKENIDVHFELK
ncbi:cyclophilin-like fold protein [Lachnospiraceae bacterium 46-61]